MKSRPPHPGRSSALSGRAVAIVLAAVALRGPAAAPASAAPATACPGGDTGITLSPGFCATVFADNLGHVRPLAVTPGATPYANTRGRRDHPTDTPPPPRFL